jgi:hypothetical protein
LNGDTNAVDKRLSVEFEVLTHCTLPRWGLSMVVSGVVSCVVMIAGKETGLVDCMPDFFRWYTTFYNRVNIKALPLFFGPGYAPMV